MRATKVVVDADAEDVVGEVRTGRERRIGGAGPSERVGERPEFPGPRPSEAKFHTNDLPTGSLSDDLRLASRLPEGSDFPTTRNSRCAAKKNPGVTWQPPRDRSRVGLDTPIGVDPGPGVLNDYNA